MNSIAASALQYWSLSASVIEILRHDPEVVACLAQERRKPCFASSYVPDEINVLYDHELYIRVNQGRITYLRNCSLKYIPTFVEVQFDRQLAMFLVHGEVVVDRTPNTLMLTQLVNHVNFSR